MSHQFACKVIMRNILWILIVSCVSAGVNGKSSVEMDNDLYNGKVLSNALDVLNENMKLILDGLAHLNQSLNDVKERCDELSKRQDALEQLIRASFNGSEKWTPILRRQDGSVDFYVDWNEYKKGFGDVDGEFFIGLEKLHILTTYGGPQELLVIVKDFENVSRFAKYDLFRIGSEGEKYAINSLGSYSGNAGDSLISHKGKKFSTFDQDNDTDRSNCAKFYKGAWWFHTCFDSHLLGPYRLKHEANKWGMAWTSWKGWGDHSVQFAEVLIRAKQN